VTADGTTSGIDFALDRSGWITGVVTDADTVIIRTCLDTLVDKKGLL
jgi:arginine repressor